MIKTHSVSTATRVNWNEWHLPFLDVDEKVQLPLTSQKKVSAGRVARTSYLTHDGKRDFDKDIELHDSLLVGGHMSPFGHVAKPDQRLTRTSNLRGWLQYRVELPDQGNFAKIKSSDRMLAGLNNDESLLNFLNSLPA